MGISGEKFVDEENTGDVGDCLSSLEVILTARDCQGFQETHVIFCKYLLELFRPISSALALVLGLQSLLPILEMAAFPIHKDFRHVV